MEQQLPPLAPALAQPNPAPGQPAAPVQPPLQVQPAPAQGQQAPLQAQPAPPAANPQVQQLEQEIGGLRGQVQDQKDQIQQLSQAVQRDDDEYTREQEGKRAWAEKQMAPKPKPAAKKWQPDPLPENGDFGKAGSTFKKPWVWAVVGAPVVGAAALSSKGIASTEKGGELGAEVMLIIAGLALAVAGWQAAKKLNHNWTKFSNWAGAKAEWAREKVDAVKDFFKSEKKGPAPQNWMSSGGNLQNARPGQNGHRDEPMEEKGQGRAPGFGLGGGDD